MEIEKKGLVYWYLCKANGSYIVKVGNSYYKLREISSEKSVVDVNVIINVCEAQGVDWDEFIAWLIKNRHLLDYFVVKKQRRIVAKLIQLWQDPNRISDFIRSYDRRLKLYKGRKKTRLLAEKVFDVLAHDQKFVKFEGICTVYCLIVEDYWVIVAINKEDVFVRYYYWRAGINTYKIALTIASMLRRRPKKCDYEKYKGIYFKKWYLDDVKDRIILLIYKEFKKRGIQCSRLLEACFE